jgi:hypothetical protein
MGVYLGVGLSSLSEILDEASGWRVAIRYIGLICFGFAFLMFLLREPERNKAIKEEIRQSIHGSQVDTNGLTYSGEVDAANASGIEVSIILIILSPFLHDSPDAVSYRKLVWNRYVTSVNCNK